jgi:hypothetical protein
VSTYKHLGDASEPLVRRAFAAYYRSEPAGGSLPEPARTSFLCELDGKQYVVLENMNGILAVYRVRTYDGILKRLRRWPADLEAGR